MNDYFATGEGRRIYLNSIVAESEDDAKNQFHELTKLDSYFHIGTEIFDKWEDFEPRISEFLNQWGVSFVRRSCGEFYFHAYLNEA